MDHALCPFAVFRHRPPAIRWLALLAAGAVALAGLSMPLPASAQPARYEIDPEHFSVGFLVDHIGYARVLGLFRTARGSYQFDEKTGTLKVCRTLQNLKQGLISLGDTKTSAGMRSIVLPQSTADLLRRRKKNAISQWIFPNPLRPEMPVPPETAYGRLKALLKGKRQVCRRSRTIKNPRLPIKATEDSRNIYQTPCSASS